MRVSRLRGNGIAGASMGTCVTALVWEEILGLGQTRTRTRTTKRSRNRDGSGTQGTQVLNEGTEDGGRMIDGGAGEKGGKEGMRRGGPR